MQDPSAVDVVITLDRVMRRFGRRVVFEDISAEVRTGQIMVITGPNGPAALPLPAT